MVEEWSIGHCISKYHFQLNGFLHSANETDREDIRQEKHVYCSESIRFIRKARSI